MCLLSLLGSHFSFITALFCEQALLVRSISPYLPTSQALARFSEYWEGTTLIRGHSGYRIFILLLLELREVRLVFLAWRQIPDAMVCLVPSCAGTERCLVCKHRMGVKESHFLHGLEHLISPCFLICTAGTILFIDHTGGCKAKLINVKNLFILLDKRFSRNMKNNYIFVNFYLCPINSTAVFFQNYLPYPHEERNR